MLLFQGQVFKILNVMPCLHIAPFKNLLGKLRNMQALTFLFSQNSRNYVSLGNRCQKQKLSCALSTTGEAGVQLTWCFWYPNLKEWVLYKTTYRKGRNKHPCFHKRPPPCSVKITLHTNIPYKCPPPPPSGTSMYFKLPDQAWKFPSQFEIPSY